MHYRILITISMIVHLLAISGLAQERYPLDKEGYVRDWLMAGPFPNEPGNQKPMGFDRDFLEGIGGEAKAEPYAGLVIKGVVFEAEKAKLIAAAGATNAWGYKESKTIDVAWKPVHIKSKSPVVTIQSHRKEFPQHYVTYLFTYLVSDISGEVHFKLGSDDGFKLWVNGEVIAEVPGCRPLQKDENRHNVKIKKGINRILLKVSQIKGGHGAVLRITTMKGASWKKYGHVILELPRQKYASLCKNLDEVDVVNKTLFAKVRLGNDPIFVGSNTLRAFLGNARPTEAALRMTLKDPGGKVVWSENTQARLSLEKAKEFRAKVVLSKAGQYVFTAVAMSKTGKALGTLSRRLSVTDKQSILKKSSEYKKTIADLQRKITAKKAKLEIAKKDASRLRKRIADQYVRMEARYKANRERAIARYGPKAKSIDKPFVPVEGRRSTLCMNGDLWQIAPAMRTPEKKIDENRIPIKGWERVTVPTFGVDKYHRGKVWPYRRPWKEFSNKPASVALDQKKLGDFKINPGREDDAMFLRTSFDLPKDWQGKQVTLFAETPHFKIKVWVNGKHVGEHENWSVPLDMDLTRCLKPKNNELVVYAGRENLYSPTLIVHYRWGLMGDVYLRSEPKVYVSDVWVIPCWRKVTLEVLTKVTNDSDRLRTVTLKQQAVLKSRVKREFGGKVIRLAPGQTKEVKSVVPWSDPELWGIGGKYGTPVLYDMVSTLSENGKAVDQSFQRFGYREFWKSKFDFFLNGKRIFLQGDQLPKHKSASTRQYFYILFTLLRNENNINIVRSYFDYNQGRIARICDELGMLYMAQNIPMLPNRTKDYQEHDWSQWKGTKYHKKNMAYYTGWVKWLRNHPSVVVYNTDNEVFTQAWPKPWAPYIRNDKIAAKYGQYVKKLDPTRIVTRGGDQGTWGNSGAWQEDPPADVANYHYPGFHLEQTMDNWQSRYEKPFLSSECLYFAYGAWNGWVGATPSQVQWAASRARHVLTYFREREVSGWVAMGIGGDGFVELKKGGNPFDIDRMVAPPPGSKEATRLKKLFPAESFYRVRWPARSGPGFKRDWIKPYHPYWGGYNINWFYKGYPGYVLNDVNRAYKECTWPMPEVANTLPAEVIYTIKNNGKPLSGVMVFLRPLEGQGTEPIGVRADRAGKVWFLLPQPGEYELTVDGCDYKKIVHVERRPNALEPTLHKIPQVRVDVNAGEQK